jgi:hypothetical protein
MSYREENGQVILTLSREDYRQVDYALESSMDRCRRGTSVRKWQELRDRLNAGNPHYTPYRVEENK